MCGFVVFFVWVICYVEGVIVWIVVIEYFEVMNEDFVLFVSVLIWLDNWD